MPILMWDASSASKRYVAEKGSPTVNALFELRPLIGMVSTITGYAETFSILQRRFNGGLLTAIEHSAAESLLRLELIEDVSFELLTTEEHTFSGLPLIRRHNINSSDATILAAFLEYKITSQPDEHPCVLIASDHRMLRAAAAEGLAVLDPETVAADDVAAFLGAL